jgi:hypothetical protein
MWDFADTHSWPGNYSLYPVVDPKITLHDKALRLGELATGDLNRVVYAQK